MQSVKALIEGTIEVKDLPYLQVGPYHTNTVAGLELAMDILRRRKNPNKQIFMITDGKPTCLKIGKKYYKNIDAATNSIGLLWDDQLTHDDVVTEQTMYVVKGKPVKLIIGSRDVIHDVGLSQFRLKMDAVPGIPTTQWFTPQVTTAEMKKRTGNPDFTYEISCDQMCGNGHFSMKGIVEVVEQEEYDLQQ